MYEIREGREEERDSVVEMLTKIFRSIESFQEWWIDGWREFWNRPEYESWALVATQEEHVVGNLAFFKNKDLNCIRGKPVPFGAVWATGVEDKHRRQGLLGRLFQQAIPMMNEHGMVLSILDPSPYQGAQIAYEKYGYAVVEQRVKHNFAPNALKTPEANPEITVRKLEDEEEYQKVADLERGMSRYGSRILNWPPMFKQPIKKGEIFLFERGSEPVGCAQLSILATDEDTKLQVALTYYKSYEVIPQIIGLINQSSANVENVEWICEPQIPVQEFTQNVHKFKTQSHGTMMMRIINFEGYCKSIKVPKSAEEIITIKLTDPLCPWNEGTYRLKTNKGKLEVNRGKQGQKIELTLAPFQLSKVIGGPTSPTKLQELGTIDCSPETTKTLETIFPTDSFLAYSRF